MKWRHEAEAEPFWASPWAPPAETPEPEGAVSARGPEQRTKFKTHPKKYRTSIYYALACSRYRDHEPKLQWRIHEFST